MSYQFIPNQYYRMPTHFGPSLGPRQGVDGRRFPCLDSPHCQVVSASFYAKKKQLDQFMPPGFSLQESCLITITFEYLTGIEWLAGRGYNTFGISVPVIYNGEQEQVHGNLLLVLWENKADPIITGREDLGFSKLYAEIPDLQVVGDNIICRASWDGFEFAQLTLRQPLPVPLAELPESTPSEGTLHYKYIPKTGCPGEADIQYTVLTPASDPNTQLETAMKAQDAQVIFNRATWEQLPTLVHIVNALSELSIDQCSSAIVVNAHGGKDLSDQRIIR